MCVRAHVPVCTCVNHPIIPHYRNQQHGLSKRGAFSAFLPILVFAVLPPAAVYLYGTP